MSAGRYVRKDATRIPVEAVLLTADNTDEVLAFLGAGDHIYEPASGILSIQTRQGVVLNIRDGSYVVRDADGHVTHTPAEVFEAAFEPESEPDGDDSVPALPESGEASTRPRRSPRSRDADAGDDVSGTGDAAP